MNVDVRDMSREELQRSVLLLTGCVKRLLKEIRANTKPEWKVRKACEEIASKYSPRLQRELTRSVASEVQKRRIERKAQRMDAIVWKAVDEPGPLDRAPPLRAGKA